MMQRLFVLILFLGFTKGNSFSGVLTHSKRQEQCQQEQREWVAQALQKTQAIQPGMTRKDLLEVFTTEGGLSSRLQRTYVSQECPYFMVDVEFDAVGHPNRDEEGRVTLLEENRDAIVRISRPYLHFSTMD